MNPCTRCNVESTVATSTVGVPSRVLLFAPAPLAMAKATAVLRDSGYSAETASDSVALLEGPAEGWLPLLEALERRLTPVEAAETRLAAVGELPSDPFVMATTALHARPVSALLADSRDAWLVDAVHGGRLTSHFQPIVDVVTGEVFAHEALLRALGNDGSVIAATDIFQAGRRAGLLHGLDQLGRSCAVESAHRLGLTGRLFINFLPSVVYDPGHCLRSTYPAMKAAGFKPEQLVFEVVESEYIPDREHLVAILNHYRSEGFGVALDDLGSGYASLDMLADLRPDFVKLDVDLVRSVANDPLRAGLVQAMVKAAEDASIGVIAEGVERAETARFLADAGVRLMQGYFFGAPAEGPGKAPARF